MDKGIKDDIKKIARETEVKLTGFLLRWKERREGNEPQDAETIERQSRAITDKANEVIKKRGQTILKEFKEAYVKGTEEKEDHKD
jgi:hypothetical protein